MTCIYSVDMYMLVYTTLFCTVKFDTGNNPSAGFYDQNCKHWDRQEQQCKFGSGDHRSGFVETAGRLMAVREKKDVLRRRFPKGNERQRLPLYQEVKQYVLESIQKGEWPSHNRIPSEHELVKRLGISRMTVHRALRELSNEGRLYRVQGVGTFVADRVPQSAFLKVGSIAEEIRSRGGVHSSEILLLQEAPAPDDIAAVMGLEAGGMVFHSILIHKDREVPIQYAERFVNPAVAPDFLRQNFDRITPSEYLLRIAPIAEAEHVVEAVMPEPEIRSLLQMPNHEPCLVLHRITWVGEIVATRSRFIHPATRFRIGSRFRVAPEDSPLV